MFVEGIRSITSEIRSNTDNRISGVVEKISDGVVTVRTQYGNISIQTNEKFVVNQNIFVGVFDLPDRANFIKLILTVDAIQNTSDKQTFEFILKKNPQMDLEKRAEISKDIIIDTEKIDNNIYAVESTSKEGKIIKHTFVFSDSNCNAQVFIKNGKIIINTSGNEFTVLNPSNEILKIISDIPRNAIIQSYVKEINDRQPQKKHQTNSRLSELLIALGINNEQDTIEERIWKMAMLLSEQNDVEAVEGFKVFFIPIMHNNLPEFIRFFVSENSAKTETHFSKRFIIEFIRDGFRNLLDCLFSNDLGNKRIDMVVRMEKVLEAEFQKELTNIFNNTMNSLSIDGSISFSSQMILNHNIIHKDILS